MNTIVIKGNITALSPIHHGAAEAHGTTKLILTMPVVARNKDTGEEYIEQVPALHGNAIRGMLRRLVMKDFFECLGYELDSRKVYHFLFTGGILEAIDNKDKGAINIELKNRIRTLIPPISLFGSALGNQMFQGKLKVGMGDLCCAETAHYHETDLNESFSAYNLRGRDFGTRLDDLKGDYEREDDEQATQMKYEFETIIKGAKFTHEFVLEDCNYVELSLYNRMMELWRDNPYVAGKSGTGYGKVKLDYPNLSDISEMSDDTDNAYLNFIKDNKADIIDLINELVSKWK